MYILIYIARMLQLHQMITDLPYPLPQDVIVEALRTVSRESAIAMLIGMHNDAKRRHQASWLILWKAARFLATSCMQDIHIYIRYM